ncbi:carboxylesterase/lipase family protein [Kutzneria sp. CA-103260]|uniref:carboxylesterase/lipase family protein n=1 Tax=Kutzneria sp. CA-103260 TaxID=2802641 RepID=UPI001BAAB129|nr:carboxylesterase family protein [Kutzneria sp. CA-103260]QUQ65707.1 carboxylesterase [Kutzneria sp. CA-103260]
MIVDTTLGAVRGRELPDGSRVFAGIPFAAPPVGELRFRPPQPLSPWTGVRDAVEFSGAPVQGVPSLVGPQETKIPALPGFPTGELGEISEDCLYLNVWVPATPADGPLPVIVWIYGGGYESGSAAPPYTDGAALARQTGAVVVAANYRLGALGFLHLADFGPEWAGATNLGLQDQMAALRWVRDNIGGFGGDAGNITLAGQSAGAFSVGTLLAVPTAAGLFHKAILQSGNASRSIDRAAGTGIAEDLVAALGLDGPAGLRTVPVERILEKQGTVIEGDIGRRNLPGGRTWGAVIDGDVVPVPSHQAVVAGVAAHIPLLIGATRDEVQLFQVLNGDRFRPADEAALLAEMSRAGAGDPVKLLDAYRARLGSADLSTVRSAFLTDAVYRRPATRLAAAQVEAGGRAYHYLFSDEPFGSAMGACHGADLLHTFDALALVGADTPARLAIRDALVQAFAAFAATGDPGWPGYDAGSSRAIGGDNPMAPEPPADDVTAAWA